MTRSRMGLLPGLLLVLAVAGCGGGRNATASASNAGGGKDERQTALNLAKCMRQQGINIPDPTPDGGIDERGIGIDPDGPKFKAAEQTCQQHSGYGDGK
jgi:hypothetical protein